MIMRRLAHRITLLVAVLGLLHAGRGVAQEAAGPNPGLVTLNLPERVELKVLVDYVGKRLGINFIYDEAINGKQVSIRANTPIPAQSLMPLVEGALKMKDLVVVRTEVPNLMRIQSVPDLAAVSAGPNVAGEGANVVTRVFPLQHASGPVIEQSIRQFLSVPKATVLVLPEQQMVIVTDYAANMHRIEQLIGIIDRADREVEVRFVPVEHVEASAVVKTVTQLMAGRASVQGTTASSERVTVVAEERTNRVVVIGRPEPLARAVALVAAMDVPLGLETRVYGLKVVSPEQVDELVRQLVGEERVNRLYRSAVNADANLLVVSATADIHEQVQTVCDAVDRPAREEDSPVRFYRLEHARAADVVATLSEIVGEGGPDAISVDGMAGTRGAVVADRPVSGREEGEATGSVLQDLAAGRQLGGAASLPDARLMADQATNAVIVIARSQMHPIYERLIRRLDVRRPQVLIEATIVAIDTSDGFSLGVEIYSGEEGSDGEVLNFTQFGLSTPDSRPGSVSLVPGVGFNGAILNADIAEVVIQALKTDTRARVVSRPSLLINDNAEGVLLSQREEPFESVNASNTVATTSFAGFAAAGTNITIAPQISEGDYLKIEYEITLSSFVNESPSSTLPPSRQTNTLASEATVPDGSTIVVGGLTRENFSSSVSRVPLLGSIPGIEYLFSNRTETTSQTTLYTFIRATILRDDKFADLKVLSEVAATGAGLPADLPASGPLEIR